MSISKEVLDEIALSEGEYEMIVERLGREPNQVELGMFGALWSEHCGYKHSKPLLGLFPSSGPRVLVSPGEENAGVVDIGDGLAIVMKIESHNHPSAIEPYEGAATGVGGIVRDIFTMGARPIALLNSLRFGPLAESRNRYLFGGVVAGISSYGNCLGIPNVGGEVFFADSYSENPLVNAMCVGIVEHGRLISATAAGVGNLLMIVGADTGRDGIHGASGLASRTFENERELRSTVQVGNPFLEKCLMEACLELAAGDAIVGMQDLGAAGLTSSAIEAASKGESGLRIDISKIPRREKGMSPYEVMLSESQERMLVIVKRGREAEVKALFDKWDLHSEIIGEVTGDGVATIVDGDSPAAKVPIKLLTEPPRYRLQVELPSWLEALQKVDLAQLPELTEPLGQVLLRLLASPNIASKSSVYRQYDHQVLDNTVIAPGADAAVLRVKGTSKGIALVTDGNGRKCYLDPFAGGAMTVAEAARNLVCVGARPIAITDGLNFGNPERADVYYQMEQCIRGMAEACKVLSLPVISGNVSLYNESRGEAIYPTPIVGGVGLLEEIDRRLTPGFKDSGDVVYLIGDQDQELDSLGGSEYLDLLHGRVEGRPTIDLALERRVQDACLQGVAEGKLKLAHDCAEGGLAVALAECAIIGGSGFSGDWPTAGRKDAAYFGEAASRIIVSVAAGDEDWVEELARRTETPILRLGSVGGDELVFGTDVRLKLTLIEAAWRGGLEAAQTPTQ